MYSVMNYLLYLLESKAYYTSVQGIRITTLMLKTYWIYYSERPNGAKNLLDLLDSKTY